MASNTRIKKLPPHLSLPLNPPLYSRSSAVSQPASPRHFDFPSQYSPIAGSPSTANRRHIASRTRHVSLLILRPTPPVIRDIVYQPPDLSGEIVALDESFSAFGGFGDVYMAVWNKGSETCTVAVKVLRLGNSEDERSKLDKRLRREIHVWKRLKHKNVIPLLGTTLGIGPSPSTGMVSPWMDNGNLSNFLHKKGPRLSVSDRFRILCDVAAGLAYLHSKFVVHGDLTGANILISRNRTACLVDFGMSSIKAEFEGYSWTSTIGGAIRWRAPELLPQNDHAPVLSNACDVYSFGNVMLHTLSGKLPYFNVKDDLRVLLQLFQGIRPRRPPTSMLTDSYWTFITQCWSDKPSSRPRIDEVYQRLVTIRSHLDVS